MFVAGRNRSRTCPSTFRLRSEQLPRGVVPASHPGTAPNRSRKADSARSTLEVRTRQLSDGVYVVTPDGELDVCTTCRLAGALSRVVEARAWLVVVDLRKARLADSAPLGLLVLIQGQLSGGGGVLVLAGADRNARDLLQATGLDGAFLTEQSLPPPPPVGAGRARPRDRVRTLRES